uniref:Uncharacterized protein n=1 Tax=Strombidium rassoulzadegani TaxID=1082188 RepID=A0A7S3CL31_9SPIT|mmetsp:Transcript_14939/g.25443  ORF Transcript_14939/g.25443 Transcript_14939/m.25443 type:complete len:111 (+) Transcript_14939:139-471(+)
MARLCLYVIIAVKAGMIYDKMKQLVSMRGVRAQIMQQNRRIMKEVYSNPSYAIKIDQFLDDSFSEAGQIEISSESMSQDVLMRILLTQNAEEDPDEPIEITQEEFENLEI